MSQQSVDALARASVFLTFVALLATPMGCAGSHDARPDGRITLDSSMDGPSMDSAPGDSATDGPSMDSAPRDTSMDGPDAGSLPTLEEMQACAVDNDCVATFSRCCECGADVDTLIGINMAYVDAYRADLCAPYLFGCDGCAGPVAGVFELWAACVEGTCEAGILECADAYDCMPRGACILRDAWSSRVCSLFCSTDDECRDSQRCVGWACTP